MAYILNLNSRTLHDKKSVDKRCRLNLIRDEHKKEFDNIDEALTYLPKGNKPTKKCTFCILRFE